MSKLQYKDFISKEEVLKILEAGKLHFEECNEIYIPGIRVSGNEFGSEPYMEWVKVGIRNKEKFEIIISKKVKL